MIDVHFVPPEVAKSDWARFAPLVARSLHGIENEMTPDDVFEGIATRRLILLAAADGDTLKGIVVLSQHEGPHMSHMSIDLVGGYDLAGWVTSALNTVKMLASKFGHAKVKALGRKGWHKYADDAGFKPKRVLYETEI